MNLPRFQGLSRCASLRPFCEIGGWPTGHLGRDAPDLAAPAYRVSNVAGKQCVNLTTCCGSADGVGTAARFYNPCGIAIDPVRAAYALVADGGNHLVRKLTAPRLAGRGYR